MLPVWLALSTAFAMQLNQQIEVCGNISGPVVDFDLRSEVFQDHPGLALDFVPPLPAEPGGEILLECGRQFDARTDSRSS